MRGERHPQKSQLWSYLLRCTCLQCHFGGKDDLGRWARRCVDIGRQAEDLGDQELERGLGWMCWFLFLCVQHSLPYFFPLDPLRNLSPLRKFPSDTINHSV